MPTSYPIQSMSDKNLDTYMWFIFMANVGKIIIYGIFWGVNFSDGKVESHVAPCRLFAVPTWENWEELTLNSQLGRSNVERYKDWKVTMPWVMRIFLPNFDRPTLPKKKTALVLAWLDSFLKVMSELHRLQPWWKIQSAFDNASAADSAGCRCQLLNEQPGPNTRGEWTWNPPSHIYTATSQWKDKSLVNLVTIPNPKPSKVPSNLF